MGLPWGGCGIITSGKESSEWVPSVFQGAFKMKRLISALLALAAAAFTPYLVLAEEPKPGENAFLCSLCASMMANTLSAFCGGEGEQPLQEIKLVNADT